jgi:hypothetical protein
LSDFEAGHIASIRDEQRRAYALELAINQMASHLAEKPASTLPTPADTIARAAVFESFLAGDHHTPKPTLH